MAKYLTWLTLLYVENICKLEEHAARIMASNAAGNAASGHEDASDVLVVEMYSLKLSCAWL